MPLPQALNPRRSLRARFALLLGGSGLVFGLVTAGVVDRYERAQLVDSLGQAMLREALLVSGNLDLALQQRLQQLRQTAAQPLLASGLMEAGDLRLLLEGLRAQQPELAWLAVTDARGQVLVATNALLEGSSVGRERWFAQAMRQPWIGPRQPAGPLSRHLGLDVAGQASPLIDLGVPLIDFQGQTLGVLVARLRWDWLAALHRAMLPPEHQLPGSDSVVLDADGRVLLGPAALLDQALALDGLAALRAGGAPQVLRWPDGGAYVTALGRADTRAGGPGPHLTVLLRQPAALAFQAADVLRERLLVLGLLGALGFSVLSLWLADRVSRPIQALSQAARRASRGEAPAFNTPNRHRSDEVVELARTLQGLHEALAQRLAEQAQATLRFQALFENAPVAIYIAVDGQVQLANQSCLQLFGATELSQLVGRATRDLVHPDDRSLLAPRSGQLRQWQPGDAPLPMPRYRIVRLDGATGEVESTVMPLQTAAGTGRGVQVVLRDVTEQRRAQALLAQRESQLAQTSRMAQVGGWALDLRTGEASWTEEAARIYELPDTVAPTRALALSYFLPQDRQRLTDAFAHTVRTGEPYDLELQLLTPAGHHKWVRAQGRAIRQDGRTVRMEGTTQDITVRRQAEEAVRELNARLEQRVAERTAELQAANAELDAFAYAVSHDLRAPLRAMSGFSQALVEDHGPQLDDEARGYLAQITQASQRMGELIEGLLALSRSVRGVLRTDDVDLSALAEAVVAGLRRLEPGRTVQVRIAPGLSARGDRRMLDAALHNLIGNAWKYSAGRADASITVEARVIDGQRWFCIIDNGAGFDMAHAGRLFKAFARLHRQDEFPGLGIGLATVQRIVHRHGGKIEATATPGQGACFRFTLPERQPPGHEEMT